MRVLGIETSTRRGSVALVENGRVIATSGHEQPNAHAEAILPLLEALLVDAGWPQSSLDRIGVGVGPGAFTGIRVGIALAQGIGLGLARPVFGVGSLEAMAYAVPRDRAGVRCPLLDARRGEVFVAAYTDAGQEHVAARAVARERVLADLELIAPGPRVIVGEVGAELGGAPELWRSERTDLPHASAVARIAEQRPEAAVGAEPQYVRDAGALLPDLPRLGVAAREPNG